MNQEVTTVRAVVRATGEGQALVEVEGGGCGRCHEEGGCGGQHLTQMFCSGPKTYRVDNAFGAAPGDRVEIAIASGNLRRSANLAYVLPLTVALLAAMLGNLLAGDAGAMLGLGLGLVAGFGYLVWRLRQASGKIAGRPHIVARSSSR